MELLAVVRRCCRNKYSPYCAHEARRLRGRSIWNESRNGGKWQWYPLDSTDRNPSSLRDGSPLDWNPARRKLFWSLGECSQWHERSTAFCDHELKPHRLLHLWYVAQRRLFSHRID